MFRTLIALPAAALILGVVQMAAAAQAADEEALAVCGESFDACSLRCEQSYPDDAAASAGCQAACAADRAVCEAKAGYEQAKPWVADQFRKMQRFFEGFSEQGRDPEPAPAPAPAPTPAPEPDSRPTPLIPPAEEGDAVNL
ncbi:MAG: hypothetical protein LDL26_04040 [Caenispirillum bisanense]|nr:hypothetical protein [Caenispirillum bisanense]MCA1972924.1 hypothetical protein [Caenispirillum sp.]